MDWKSIVAELMEGGVKQSDIAKHCGVAQSTVSDVHTGRIETPNFDFGTQLLQLHQEVVGERKDSQVEH